MTEWIPAIVYVLCLITSCACAWLLVRSYRQNGARLLLWAGACFSLLAVNNLALLLDLLVWPQIDLSLLRQMLSLAAVSALLWGFVWEEREG